MRSPLNRVDVVGVGAHVFGIAVVVLQGNIDVDSVLRPDDRHDFRKQRSFSAVQPGDIFDQPPGVAVFLVLPRTLIAELNADSLIEKGQLLQPLLQRVEHEFRIRKDLAIGLERDFRSRRLRGSQPLQAAGHFAAGKLHHPHMLFPANFDFEPFRERVDDRNAHPVQTAGARFVTPLPVEFSPRADFSEHNFDGRTIVHFGHRADGNAAAIVGDGGAAVGVDAHGNQPGESVHGLVDRVIDHFIDQVMQPPQSRVANVH